MGYKTTRHVDFDGKSYPAGKLITLPDAVRDELLALVPPAIEATGADADGKPLAKMAKAELMAIVEAEEVEIADGATNAMIVAAIEAKRASAE